MININLITILLYSFFSVVIYYIVPQKIRKFILLGENFIFYFLCDFKFFILLFCEIAISWGLSHILRKSKKILLLSILFVCFFLFIFKYFNFFIDIFNLPLNYIILPLGISYYSFKIISYIVDVYLKKIAPEESFVNYAIYISFFPHLVCGPIVRADSIILSLKKGVQFQVVNIEKGVYSILYGLFMKTVIADRCAIYVNNVFSNMDLYSSIALLVALVLYSVQLYCDFAGYSKIAIGITNLFGFNSISNFERPYLSENIKEFWRRWHISLSSWLRDYIYIPLGGNRCSNIRKYVNVFVVFITCGIWHGASLNFLLWGTYHGILNNLSSKKTSNRRILRFLRVFGTYILVLFGWLLFKLNSIADVGHYIFLVSSQFSINYNAITNAILAFTGDNSSIPYCLTLVFMIFLLIIKELTEERNIKRDKPQSFFDLKWAIIFFVFVVFFSVNNKSNFLYANF